MAVAGRSAADHPPRAIFEVLHQMAVAIAGVLDPTELARLVEEYARALVQADTVGVWLFDEPGGTLRALHENGDCLPQHVADLFAGRIDGGRPDPAVASAAIAVPLMVGMRPVGALEVRFDRSNVRHQTTRGAVERLSLLADTVAPALGAARLHETMRAELVECHRREEELQFQTQLLDAVEHALIMVDMDLTVRYWNHAAETLFGWRADEVVGHTTREVLEIADTVRSVTSGVLARAAGGESSAVETALKRRDGTTFPAFVASSPVRAVDGKVVGLISASIDLTELSEARRQTRRSEQLFRSMFEQHPDAAFAFDTEGHVILANPACAELAGYSLDEILMEQKDYAPPSQVGRDTAFFRAALQGEPQRFESKLVRKDGHELSVWVTQFPIVVDGQITGVFGIARDISEQLQAIDELRASEQRFRTLAENSPDIILRYDAHLRLVYMNSLAQMLVGTSARTLNDDVVGEGGESDPFSAIAEPVLRRALQSGAQHLVKIELSTIFGPRTFEARMAAEPAADGSIQSIIVAARDITDRERVEQERAGVYQQLFARQEELRQLIERLIAGRDVELQRVAARRQVDSLTERERQVLRLVARGLTNREIGAELRLSRGTVKNELARILEKLDVVDRTQAAVEGARLGLLEDPA